MIADLMKKDMIVTEITILGSDPISQAYGRISSHRSDFWENRAFGKIVIRL